MEGSYRGLTEILPAPFNVVLEDDTFKGEMTIGLKFIPNVSLSIRSRAYQPSSKSQMTLNFVSFPRLCRSLCTRNGSNAWRRGVI